MYFHLWQAINYNPVLEQARNWAIKMVEKDVVEYTYLGCIPRVRSRMETPRGDSLAQTLRSPGRTGGWLSWETLDEIWPVWKKWHSQEPIKNIVYTIQYNTIQYNTIQYNTIQYNTIQYNTTLLFWKGNSFAAFVKKYMNKKAKITDKYILKKVCKP